MIYTVTFNPALDYVVWLDSLLPGRINRARREAVQYGGKGINVSTVLHNLGVDNVALGFLAGFTGRALEEGLREAGLRTDFIWLPQGLTRINVKVKGRDETEINGQGPALGRRELLALITPDYIVRPSTVDESTVTEGEGEQKITAPYSEVYAAYESEDHFFLFMSKRDGYIMKKSDFIQGDPAQFAAFLREKTGRDVRKVTLANIR